MESAPLLGQARALEEDLRRWRRDFHMHPELGFQEHRSGEIIAAALKGWGYEVREGVAGTGVLGYLQGSREGRTVMLRFDMDALPIQEESKSAYASKHEGIMHACGHDGHMAIGLGVAKLLADSRDSLPGHLLLVFQPAEEGLGGAERMLAEGALKIWPPERALGMHLWNEKPVGWLGLTPGPVMAGADRLEILLKGQGGHAAMPHKTRDPVPAAAQVIAGLQSIVARNVDPLAAAVLTIGVVQAGTAFNIIPDRIRLEGTVRTFDEQTRAVVLRRARDMALQQAEAFGCQAKFVVEPITPPLVNDPESTRLATEIARELFPDWLLEPDFRVMGSEDMAFFLREVPGVYLFLGSSSPEKGLVSSHHTPTFDFDEQVLPAAAALMASVAIALMSSDP